MRSPLPRSRARAQSLTSAWCLSTCVKQVKLLLRKKQVLEREKEELEREKVELKRAKEELEREKEELELTLGRVRSEAMFIQKETEKKLVMTSVHRLPMYGADTSGVGPAHRLHFLEGVDDAERRLVKSMFHESLIGHEKRHTIDICEAPSLLVLDVKRVHTPPVAQAYMETLLTSRASALSPEEKANAIMYNWQPIEAKFPANRNEILAWHGTKPESIVAVEQEGLDARLARSGGMYGMGLYFSPHASKSDMYQHVHVSSV